MSTVPLGQTSMIFFIAALICGRFRKLVHGDAVFTTGLFGGFASFLCVFVGYRLLARDGLVSIGTLRLWHKASGTLLLGLLSTPFVCLALKRMDAFVGNIATTEVIEDVLD